MRVLSLLNQKGGVGKTSTCHHLAGAFAKRGLRVLLIDNDPQSSLTQGLLGPDAALAIEPGGSIASIYSCRDPIPESVIRPSGVHRIDLVPGSSLLGDWNLPRPHEATGLAPECLARFLCDVDGSYEIVLIDCPPNLQLCSWAALVASDHVIIPLIPEEYSAQGIASVLEFVERLRSANGKEISLLGLLQNRCGFRKTLHRMFDKRLRKLYGDLVFRTRVREAVAYPEAIGRRLPIELYQHRSAAASDMRSLAMEILDRVESAIEAETTDPVEAI